MRHKSQVPHPRDVSVFVARVETTTLIQSISNAAQLSGAGETSIPSQTFSPNHKTGLPTLARLVTHLDVSCEQCIDAAPPATPAVWGLSNERPGTSLTF